MIASQFSLANAENPADLFLQIVEINKPSSHTEKTNTEIYSNSADLTDDTAYRASAPTSITPPNKTRLEN